jgi:hypothetical protein
MRHLLGPRPRRVPALDFLPSQRAYILNLYLAEAIASAHKFTTRIMCYTYIDVGSAAIASPCSAALVVASAATDVGSAARSARGSVSPPVDFATASICTVINVASPAIDIKL